MSKINEFRKFAAAGSVLFMTIWLGGCNVASLGLNLSEAQTPLPPDSIEADLLEKADSVSDSLRRLALVEQASAPQSAMARTYIPPELTRMVAIEWNGPIEPIARRLAREAGYDFSAVGSVPATPVTVMLSARPRPLSEQMMDVGLQARSRAVLAVNPTRRSVELRYTAS